MGARMREHDWSTSPLGALQGWPQSLRSAVSIMLHSRHPMFIAWGPQLAFLYNESYIPLVGAKHPQPLGHPFAQIWAENWHDVWVSMERALAGEATWSEDMHLIRMCNGYPEDTWCTFSYSPVRDEGGAVGGVFCACIETTAKVLAEQRLQFQLALGERLMQLTDPAEIMATAAETLARQLIAPRIGYAEIDSEQRTISVERDWTMEGTSSLAGTTRELESFGPALVAELRAGRTLRLDDIAADPRSEPYVCGYASMGVHAGIMVPLTKEGRLTALLYVHESRPRRWSDAEVALARDAAQRTWSSVARARAEQERGAAERILNQERIAESARLRELFAQAPGFMAVLRGPEHVFELANEAFVRLVGERELLGKTVREALPDVAGQGFYERLDHVYATGESSHTQEAPIKVQRSSGAAEQRFVDFMYQPVIAPAGGVTAIFVEGYDVTERKRANEALRESEMRLRLAMQAGRMAQVTFYPGTGRVDHSPEYAELLGYDRDRELSLPEVRNRYHPADMERVMAERAAILTNPENYYEVEHRVTQPDGTLRWLYGRGEVGRDERGTAVSVNAVYLDVTEQKRIEAALRESETQFRTFAQAVPNQVWAADVTGRLYWFNERVYEYTGFSPGDLGGHAWSRVLHQEDLLRTVNAWSASLAKGTAYEIEFRIRRADGAYRWHLARALPIRAADGSVLRWIGTNTDIEDQKLAAAELASLNATLETRVQQRSNELREAEEALRHAQKMEAVGQLTGGIAHDFNNMLTGIIGSLDIVRRRFHQGRISDVDRFIEAAITSASRAAGLTHRLLAFSRRQSLDPKPIEMNRLVASMGELLQRTLGENISLIMNLQQDLWMAEADENQLESSLLNLVINARDAMPEGGRLTVRTHNEHMREAHTAGPELLLPGEYVVLCVNDNGVGMPPDVVQRAFDPFFTTKPMGQGTGLGLSMIYGFVKQSRGHVQLQSELGRGTTVKLYLPRSRGEAQPDVPSQNTEAPRARAGETVLIVEDDAAVRMLVIEVLREFGYAFVEAGDAQAAVPILQSSQRIDLLISDVGLPGMDGRQLADVARRVRPELKVLFTTGYAQNASLRSGFLEPGMDMIMKPFALDALATKIRGMLIG
jgi:PAS domain S-box-containing protein